MDIFTAVKTVYSKYATFSGRASRAEYWYFFLFTIIAGAALSAIEPTLASAFSIANLVPNLAAGGGVGVLVGVVLFVVLAVYWIYLMAKRGDAGSNRFGEPS